MKRLLIASDDDLTRAWVRAAVEGLDLTIRECAVSETSEAALSYDAALIIGDAGRDSDTVAAAVEQAVAKGAEAKLLLLIEAEALAALRLPVRVGADFFVRGASSAELTARTRNLLWPGEEISDDEIVRVDDLTLNLATYQAHIGGRPVDFTYLEYALFAFLATHPGRTYSREALLRRVWGSDYFGGLRTVDVHVRRVRAKIGPELSRRLETVRNVGYLWNA